MTCITVDTERCKGCGLCVHACPRGIIRLDANTLNSKGFHTAACTDAGRCTGCAFCALMCPDVCITVYKEAGVCQSA